MGILNVTPDSFYDGGQWHNPEKAIQHGIRLYEQGADMLDIGGESTRPQAIPVSEQEELDRVIPVIRALKQSIPIPLSIDTMKPRVARAALEAGASFINDVGGLRDPLMQQLAAETGVPVCVMHMSGDPSTMQQNPHYDEGIIPYLLDWFKKQIDSLLRVGIKEGQIILDPGIGFGKTVAHNVEILHNLAMLKALGFPLLFGASRKSFLAKLLNKPASELLSATLAVNMLAIQSGVNMIRVHDVAEHRDIINLLGKLNSMKAT